MRPDWLRIRLPSGENFHKIKTILRSNRLHTVCEEALCPNIGVCFEQRTATFLILGDVCTRQCGFCGIKKGNPSIVDFEESYRIAEAVERIKLKYIVITSVTRDDLHDGGAFIYSKTIQNIKERINECKIEVLIPDFSGNIESLKIVLEASPDVLNHNIETVPRLYSIVRPVANYRRSIELLRRAKNINPLLTTKSGLMLGLDEELDEIIEVLLALREVNCDIVTLGQYLRPSKNALPVQQYYTPEEFEMLRNEGIKMGFKHVESGPLVRSSYHAKVQSDCLSK